MWNLLIADDETIIRRGLKGAVDWEKFSIDIVGEAEDGELALDMAKQLKPDLLLIDICMPFLNGIDLIKQLENNLPDSLFIIITGHDEFTYAKQAVRMKVFDYLLKPVNVTELESVVERAVSTLQINSQNINRNKQLESNKDLLKSDFLQKWVTGFIPIEEDAEEFHIFDIKFVGAVGVSVIKIRDVVDIHAVDKFWSDELLLFSLKNIIKDILTDIPYAQFFDDQRGNVVIIVPEEQATKLAEINLAIKEKTETFIGKVIIYCEKVTDHAAHIPLVYKELYQQLNTVHQMSPIVILAKNYIDQHYADTSLSLNELANYAQVSPTYLSKQFKTELGASFIQYLTKVRIDKALLLMKDPYLKVYEISERVGYSTQHYFCNAFKKVVGKSPSSYRRGYMQ
ncbi:response regulator [Bacillus sp. CECT 9360]|uniref:response regulator transcription factor n=1 Tax=Bacillus sp. CECT 9360 TaxID=2845821 RepID=UPI001E2C152F|nr:response regulator [Bacillus sp. CECT 9360]CAH0343898.1 Regulator of RpoS [Bacillus sp. CECT 9360]